MPGMQRLFLLASSIIALAAPVFAPSSAFAVDVPPPPLTRTHDQAMQTPWGRFIQNLGDRAMKVISNKQIQPTQRTNEFSQILSDCFDLKTIGRFVIGRTWNTATPQQQSEYLDLFKSLVVQTYADRMTLYTGEGFVVVGTRPESDMDTTVLSQITHPDGSKPTEIDWRVRQKDSKLGVIDVVVEGVSLSVTQKQEYAAIIQNNDGRIDALLQKMREQIKAGKAVRASN